METSLVLVLFLACTVTCATKKPKRPHIVLMVADDLGWSDVSFHGSKQIPTPNIDAIARDGIILNQYYTQPICSPSRAALMTGKYPIRLGFQDEVIIANSPWGLPLEEKLLPQYLKDLKYTTHAVGKWHLGFFKEEYLPHNRGFDSFFGYYNGLEDYFTHFSQRGNLTGLDLHCNGKPVWKYNGTYGADLFTAKAKKIIFEHNPTKPLFLYFAQQAVHSGNHEKPLEGLPKYTKNLRGIDHKKRKTFAGVVSALDISVGEIFNALDKSGLLDNTIFIFTTDNGGAVSDADGTYGSNFPLRGSKYSLWEGGTRGVSFIWSPSLRKSWRVHNGFMHITDWLPTLLSAAGGTEALNMLPDIDGMDQWPTIASLLPSPRSEILLNIDNVLGIEAIRRGRFKLVKGTYHNGSLDGWYDRQSILIKDQPPIVSPLKEAIYEVNYLRYLKRSKAARILWRKYGKFPYLATHCFSEDCEDLIVKCEPRPPSDTCNPVKEACLFDIVSDPCEFYNLADTLPEVTDELQKAMDKYRPFIVPVGEKKLDPEADPKLHGNVWSPWK